VALTSIHVPEGKDVIAHRVIGFSSGDDYEYDWDNVDWSKPQSEWPRAYFAPEKNFKNNYVISDLAPVDATIQLTDTTTEGATMDAALLTQEWLGKHGYLFGEQVDAPWVWNEGNLTLWFEYEISSDIEQVEVPGGMNIQGSTVLSDGLIEVYNLQGALVISGIGQITTSNLQSGVYVIKSASSSAKLLIP
jgi:hypothetical protein